MRQELTPTNEQQTDVNMRFASPKKVCRIYDISLSRVYKMMSERQVKSAKLGRARRIDLRSVDDFFASHLEHD